MGDKDSDEEGAGKQRRRGTARDLQKSQLDKLMAKPEKPVNIPEGTRTWKPREPPEFVRFYMGSSAGAGSEVYHVYRHLRRRENMRQQYISEEAQKETLEDEFQSKLAANRQADQEKTDKKRAKRLKKKQRKKEKKGSTKAGKDDDTEDRPADNIEKEDSHSVSHDSSDGEDTEHSHFVIGGR